MTRKFSLFFILFALAFQGFGQTIKPADLKKLKAKEDSLAIHARIMVTDSLTENRMRADSFLIRTLIRALQVNHSFEFGFDSVLGISKLYAPDSLFRIFSWTLAIDDYYSRQRGAIQMRTADGSLKLFPLRDVSEFSMNILDSTRNALNWIGAVYYNMVKTTHRGQSFYTLFGIDNFGVMSNKKWIEVLHFDPKGQPQFGGPFFSFAEDSVKKADQYRIELEHKEDSRIIVVYDPELKMIVFDHLVPEEGEPEKKWTYVPDGDYEGFKWVNGKWVHIEKIFNFKLQDGQAPREIPVFQEGEGNRK